MKYPRLLRKLRWPAALLLLVCYASASWAQGGSWQEEMARIKAPLEERDPAAFQQMLREAAATDRAVAAMDLAKLVVYTYNFGNAISGDIFSSGRCHFPNSSGTSRGYIFNATPALGIEAGPWFPTALVHENSDFHALTRVDWEAKDGSRGVLFSDPPVLRSGYPVFALSDQPATWPSSGWPAPESVEVIWAGTDTWKKWERVGDRNAYCVFDDSYADREGDGQSGPLGIEVRKRAIAYGAMNVVFMQYEYRNLSTYNFTGVYVGSIVDKGSPSVNDWTGAYMLYDAGRNLIWSRASNFANDTHYRGGGVAGSSTTNEQLAFAGEMYIESPGGNYRESPYDPDNPGTNYVSDPTTVINRLAMIDWGDRVLSDEQALYGALSGRVDLMESDMAQNVWKGTTDATKVLMQNTADYQGYNTSWDSSTDHFYYVSYGPITWNATETFDMVVAYVGGYTESAMLESADKAIHTYKIQFKGPSAPPAPTSFAANGILAGPAGRDYDPRIHQYPLYYAPSGNIVVSWDPSATYTTPDPSSNLLDFQGVRIYRSMDRGGHWGNPITDKQGNEVGWVPYRQWDISDGISGEDGLSPTYLGDDTGMVTSFIDDGALDGVEYWYAICAYDAGEWDGGAWGTGTQVLRSLESPRGSDPSVPTVIAVVSGSRPNGYVAGEPSVTGAVRLFTDLPVSPDATVTVNMVNDGEVQTASYRLTTTFGTDYGTLSYADMFGVILENTTTGDTLINNMAPELSDYGTNLLPSVEGIQVVVDTDWNFDPDASSRISYSFPDEIVPYSGYEMSFGDRRFMVSSLDSYDMDDLADVFCPIEIHWSATETQLGYAYSRSSGYVYSGIGTFPGRVYDVSDPDNPRQVNVCWSLQDTRPPAGNYDYNIRAAADGTYRSYMAIMNSDYDAGASTVYVAGSNYRYDGFDFLYETWLGLDQAYLDLIAADPTYTMGEYLDGKVNYYNYRRTMKAGNTYTFSTTASSIDEAEVDLDDITVVPNPYYIYAEWDQSVNRRKIQFRNVPAEATIEIYTLTGELVAVLDHTGDATAVAGARNYNSNRIGTVDWNLWTYEYTEAAYGLYIYVVKSDAGTKVGKFAIIR